MKFPAQYFLVGVYIILCCFPRQSNAQSPIDDNFVVSDIQFAEKQYTGMLKALPSREVEPKTLEDDGTMKIVGARAWTSGYFPASLWYLYQLTADKLWKQEAEKRTEILIEQKKEGLFAIGFIHCMLNAYVSDPQPEYRKALLASAKELASKFDSKVGMIKAWEDRPRWNYPVMVDHLANLEVMFWAAKNGGKQEYYDLAYQQAIRTLQEHVRNDSSVFQVVDYDSISGKIVQKTNYQGLSDTTTWSRGQGWAIYGFAMIYRETADKQFLDAAQHLADYFIRNSPEDRIPYWDFNDPAIPHALKDASAAALACSALLELGQYAQGEEYLIAAKKILNSLSCTTYSNVLGENHHFLLKHSVGNKPGGKEIDVPLIYADYYYLEALVRFEKSRKK